LADLDELLAIVYEQTIRRDVFRAEPALAKLGRSVLGPEVVRVEPAVDGAEEPAAGRYVLAAVRIMLKGADSGALLVDLAPARQRAAGRFAAMPLTGSPWPPRCKGN